MKDNEKILESSISKFMDRLCVKYGICLPLHDREEIENHSFDSSEEIARTFMIKEGLDPDMYPDLFREIKNEYNEFMNL